MKIRYGLCLMMGGVFWGCATTGNVVSSSTKDVWKAMLECSKEAAVNPFRAKCEERFAETPITAPIDKIEKTKEGPILTLAITQSTFLGSTDQMVCEMSGTVDPATLETLSPGDVVTVRGKMGRVEKKETITVTTIYFSGCEILKP